MNLYFYEDAVRQRVKDLLREAENSRNSRLLAAGRPPRALAAVTGPSRLVGRLARSAWARTGRFHRRHADTELVEGTVDRWLRRTRSAAGERDGAQEVA